MILIPSLPPTKKIHSSRSTQYSRYSLQIAPVGNLQAILDTA